MPTVRVPGVCCRTGLLVLILLVGGCSFHLRGDHALPERIGPVWITGVGRFSEFRDRLGQGLEASGIAVTADRAVARTLLVLRNYGGDQFVTALDDDGKAAEYELNRTVGFSLQDAATREELVPWQHLEKRRLYNLAPATGFGKAMEREEIIDQLDQAMVEDILRTLRLRLR